MKDFEEFKYEPSIINWYVDIVKINRKTYFLFTNSLTLFSFYIYMGTKKEQVNIEEHFMNQLLEQLIREIGTKKKYQHFFKSNMDKVIYSKTGNPSILGSMTDFKNTIRYCSEREPIQPNFHISTINSINIMPMGYLKYLSPIQSMKEELDFRIELT